MYVLQDRSELIGYPLASCEYTLVLFCPCEQMEQNLNSHRCFLLRQCIECAAIRTFFWTTSSLVLFYSSVHSACDFHVNPEANYRSHHSSHPRTQSRGFWSIWILGEFHLLTLLSVVCAGYTIEWTAATHVSTSQHRRVLERHKSCLKGFWSRSGW